MPKGKRFHLAVWIFVLVILLICNIYHSHYNCLKHYVFPVFGNHVFEFKKAAEVVFLCDLHNSNGAAEFQMYAT